MIGELQADNTERMKSNVKSVRSHRPTAFSTLLKAADPISERQHCGSSARSEKHIHCLAASHRTKEGERAGKH